MIRSNLLVLAAILATSAAGCAEPAPDAPTWFADVQPILIANCARCHGATPWPAAPVGVRLDRFVPGDLDPVTTDVFDALAAIQIRAVEDRTMPLDYALPARQREILARWIASGAPRGDRGNQVPTATLVAPTPVPAQVDQELALTVLAQDLDGDALAVAIGVRDTTTGDTYPVAGGLGGGLGEVLVDTGQLASGRDVEVYAVVDDGFAEDPTGNQHEVVLVPALRVDHGVRGTAPTVRLLAPNGGETVLGETTIAWSATDPDVGDEILTIELDLIRVATDGTGTVDRNLARGLRDVASFAWDPTGVPASDGAGAIEYRVRVTATDTAARNTRSDESDATFTIAPAMVPTSLTWDDVKPVFVQYCTECHGDMARTMALDNFRLDKYDVTDPAFPGDTDLGVYEQRAQVYQRLVSLQNMPPASAQKPSPTQRTMVGEWIVGGAPRGGAPTDAAPTFVWTTPNDSAITRTTTGTVTLAWTTADPEGLTLTGAIEYAPLTATADQTARCDATLTGWIALPATVTAGSYVWMGMPAPAPPRTSVYYCLRGTVRDPGGNATTRVAGRPIKYAP